MVDISQMVKTAQRFASDNSPMLLTGLSVASTITAAVLAGRGGYKSAQVIAEFNERESHKHPADRHELTHKERFILTARFYMPAALACGVSVGSAIYSNKISASRTAAMAAAVTIVEKSFGEYKDKVAEKLGEKAATQIHDEVAQDRVTDNPASRQEIILTGSGDALIFEMYTGRYFRGSMEELKRAENDINYKILHQDHASLSDLYDRLGLPHTQESDELGWNQDNPLDFTISTTLSDNNVPCIAFSYGVLPIRDHYRFR